MEAMNIIKKQTTNYMTNSLSINKDTSQMISKPKPKIRIIHIFAPEIIKTDVANFRELVQRLTGKPTTTVNRRHKKKNKPDPILMPSSAATRSIRSELVHDHQDLLIIEEPTSCGSNRTTSTTATSSVSGGGGGSLFELKEEDDEVYGFNNGSGFLNGFSDFDGFIQDLGDFPLMAPSNLHAF